MTNALRLLILTIALLFGSAGGEFAKALAAGLVGGPNLWLSCENRADYRFRPLAVSDTGDVVTGHLLLRQRRGVHVRLVPMGGGYRYAGRGVWFDGARETVYLYLSKYRPIACTIVQGPERARG